MKSKSLFTAALILSCIIIFAGCDFWDKSVDDTQDIDNQETEKYTVVFKQNGFDDIKFFVNRGEPFTEIPRPNQVKGHTTMWSVTDFSNITEDITVTAISTPNRYTVTYKSDGETVSTAEILYGQSLTPPNLTKDEYILLRWQDEETGLEIESGNFAFDSDKTFIAVWDKLWSEGY